jgi:hypothetical protein
LHQDVQKQSAVCASLSTGLQTSAAVAMKLGDDSQEHLRSIEASIIDLEVADDAKSVIFDNIYKLVQSAQIAVESDRLSHQSQLHQMKATIDKLEAKFNTMSSESSSLQLKAAEAKASAPTVAPAATIAVPAVPTAALVPTSKSPSPAPAASAASGSLTPEPADTVATTALPLPPPEPPAIEASKDVQDDGMLGGKSKASLDASNAAKKAKYTANPV